MPHLSKPQTAGVWALIFLIGATAGGLGVRRTRERLEAALVDEARRGAAALEPEALRQLTGTRDDRSNPAYASVKRRLIRWREVDAAVRRVALLRFDPETDRVIYLADAARPGPKNEAQPGDDDPAAAQLPGLQAAIRSGQPAVDGPAGDESGRWVAGYALVAEAPSTRPGVPVREIVALERDAADWNRALGLAAFQWAFYGWVLLGLPFAAHRVIRRQLDQRGAIRNLSEAMEQSHSALLIVDLESRIEYANRGLCRQIGYSRRELIGRPWRDFQVTETPPEKIAELVSTVRSGQAWEGEWFNRRKDGTVYPVRGVVTPVKNRAGAIANFIAVFDDMTEVKRTEAELREARDLALAGDRAKGQFLATMSHEVRTPLNGIVGFTSLLLETALTSEQREYVQTIRTGGEALVRLTSDILDFARIESGRVNLEPLPCNPADCVEEALDLLAARAAQKNLVLLHWVEDDVPATILADAGRLRQVLINLVGNAVKFTEAGEVEVTIARGRDEPEAAGAAAPAPDTCLLRFAVRDTGIGIPPEQHEKLFKPFAQLDASSTRKFGGTGLGLAICRNLVRLMAGEISLVSEPGRGSTFVFCVRVPVVAPAAAAPDLAGMRVACVAPPGALRRELARLAGRWQAQLTEAATPAELGGAGWDTGLVVLDEPGAQALAGQPPLAALPPAQTFALVPVTLSTELRTALRAHFRLLVNQPVHHGALFALLHGVPAGPVPTVPPLTRFGLRVLVVEDNPVNQRLVQRFLSNLGCQWTVAENGRDAVAELARTTADYDLALMDLHMPEMDGITAVEEIRAGHAGGRAETLWIVVLTADARDNQRQRALAAGVNDYLTKPVRLPELEAALRRYCAARGVGVKV